MIRRLLRSERGLALVIVLAFMVLAVPLITSTLNLASTLSIDSRIKTRILKSHYSALGGSQHALYRLVYDTGYAEGLPEGVEDTYTITLNGREVVVTTLKLSDPPDDPMPTPADDARRLQALKQVVPEVASPYTPTIFTYTVTIVNQDNDPENLRKIHDVLPVGFSYEPGSTRGLTSREPSVLGQWLIWDLASLRLTLQPGEAVTLVFDAEASVPEGSYCNQAWVEPGGTKTGTGKTAIVKVGNPASSLCQGPAVSISKTVEPSIVPGNVLMTYAYTINIRSLGTSWLSASLLRDLLPAGFLYVPGSTSGDMTSANPTTTMYQGRQRLDWTFAPPKVIPPGEARTLRFFAQATLSPGDYWNEVWVTFEEFPYPIYTWPTAVVKAMGVFETLATDGKSEASAEVWVGTDSVIVKRWTIVR